MTDLQKIKVAPDRVARQESGPDGRVHKIVWSSAKLGLEVEEKFESQAISAKSQTESGRGKEK